MASTPTSSKVPPSIAQATSAVKDLNIPSRSDGSAKESSLQFNRAASKSRGNKRESFSNPFANKFKKKDKTSGNGSGVEIMDFYSKAERKATVHTDKSQSIFNIISNRYQRKKWSEIE